jgi:VanZ family protein
MDVRAPPNRVIAVVTARIAAWLLFIAIVILSFVPVQLRPETPVPHKLEHLAIFFPTGVAFGYGYGRRPILLAAALVLFAAMLEIGQLFVEGRHARLSDFIVDGGSLCIGVVVASFSGARAIWESV